MDGMAQSKQIKILRATVFVLGALLLGLIAYVASSADYHGDEAASALQPPLNAPINPWAGLSLTEKLRRSSAVIIADLRPANGRLQAIATDVLVLTPGTDIHYRPGQEVTSLSHPTDGPTDWGDGTVALLTGSPASIQESYSVRAGRISGLGDMSVEDFRRLADAR